VLGEQARGHTGDRPRRSGGSRGGPCNTGARSFVHGSMVAEPRSSRRSLHADPVRRTWGAPASFEELFESQRVPLFKALCLLTGDRQEAEDIAQDAFVRVLERWERVGGLEDPVGYLYRTAMNAPGAGCGSPSATGSVTGRRVGASGGAGAPDATAQPTRSTSACRPRVDRSHRLHGRRDRSHHGIHRWRGEDPGLTSQTCAPKHGGGEGCLT